MKKIVEISVKRAMLLIWHSCKIRGRKLKTTNKQNDLLISNSNNKKHKNIQKDTKYANISRKRPDIVTHLAHPLNLTRKPSCRWQTRATRKHAKIAPNRRAYNVVADNNGLSSFV